MRTVMAFGSFDILHPGHIKYLGDARKLGDRLVVVVARDESIMRFKKRRPVLKEAERLRIVSALKVVDSATLGSRISRRQDLYSVLLRYRPDVIALGYDQKANVTEMKAHLKEHGINARVVRIGRMRGYSSSRIRKRLRLQRLI